ncbi:hypothetical protein AXF42_Ash006158 [Apostasia shenzhenica]|uniref:Uncharacterized protein n=1 Tax=Apostasia shenzhenica TaxID=1088818 RepID=A0A2I0B0D8_9ASPA|nr:hypothetical protein AXF42_Ash006158 [Apostasia shenzhenica]
METLSPEHIRRYSSFSVAISLFAQGTLDDAVDSSEDSKSEPKRVLENCNHDLVVKLAFHRISDLFLLIGLALPLLETAAPAPSSSSSSSLYRSFPGAIELRRRVFFLVWLIRAVGTGSIGGGSELHHHWRLEFRHSGCSDLTLEQRQGLWLPIRSLEKDFRSNLEISGISRRRTGKGRRLVEFARRGRLGRNPKHQGIDGDTQPGTDSEELAQTLDDVVDSTEDSMYELKRILEDYRHNLLVKFTLHCILYVFLLIGLDVRRKVLFFVLTWDLTEAYIEQVKGELNSVEEANIKASSEIDALEERISYDLAKLDHDCEALSCLLDITDSKVLELNHQVERMRCNLTTLEERQHILKSSRRQPPAIAGSYWFRYKILSLLPGGGPLPQVAHRHQRGEKPSRGSLLETIGTLGNVLYGVKCIQCDDNYIKLSLRTPIPSVDFLTFPKELGFSLKSSVLEHELAIEVADKTTELKSVEKTWPQMVEQAFTNEFRQMGHWKSGSCGTGSFAAGSSTGCFRSFREIDVFFLYYKKI